MKRLLFIAFSFLFKPQCYPQGKTNAVVLEDAIRSLNEPDAIIYIDSAINFYGLVRDIAKRGHIRGHLDEAKAVLHLRKAEIRLLDRAFKNDTSFVWSRNLFLNSIMVPMDSASYYRLNIKERTVKKGKRYFQLSRVIYFRDESFAVFRLAEMFDHSAGYDYLFF